MSKKLQLNIPEPCHENWDAMTPVEKGKFCGSCQKQVVDFSNKTDREIALFFKKPSTGSVCGRFMEDQLGRDMEIPKKRIPWLRYFFTIGLPAFFAMKASGQMGKIKVNTIDTVRNPYRGEPTLGIIADPQIRPQEKTIPRKPLSKMISVNGRVVDNDGETIAYATVTIINNQKAIITDEKGRFKFNTGPEEKLIEMEVTAFGFKPQQYIYPFTFGHTSVVEITIQLTPSPTELPEVVVDVKSLRISRYLTGITVSTSVVACTKPEESGIIATMGTPSIIQVDTVRMQSDSIFKKIVDLFKPSSFRIYPNPTQPGSTIHIEWKKHEGGDYKIELFSQQGQLVFMKEVSVTKEQEVWLFELPAITPGTYIVKATHKKSQKSQSGKIVVL